MGAIRALARTELRRRRRALVLLALLVGVIGAAALTAATMARRTSTAFERLTRATHAEDILTLVLGDDQIAERIAALDGVASTWIPDIGVGKVISEDAVSFLGVAAGPPPPPDLFAPIPVDGRMFDAAADDEAVVTETFAEAADLEVGGTIPLQLITVDQFDEFATGIQHPRGPAVTLRITGIIRYPNDPDALLGVIASPAFARRYWTDQTDAGSMVLVRLEDPSDTAAFSERLVRLGREIHPASREEAALPFEIVDPRVLSSAVGGTARVLVTGLAVFAIIASIAGSFVLLQIAARHHASSADDQTAERALGVTGRQRAIARVLPAMLAAAVGALLAVGAAIGLSQLAPLGAIAAYEPAPGVEANLLMLGAGAVGIIAAVSGIEGLAAARAGRPRRTVTRTRPSWLAERIATMGGRPPVVVGLRFAYEPGRGAGAVPVRSVLAGTILGITGLIAVTAFGASLTRLTSEPPRYGFQGDLHIVDLTDAVTTRLTDDERIAAVTTIESSAVRLTEGRDIPAYRTTALEGDAGWTMLEGRTPDGPLEVTVGSRLARDRGLAVGDLLEIEESSGGTRSLTVVGIGLGPTLSNEPFGSNMLLAGAAFDELRLTAPTREALVTIDSAAPRTQVIGDYRADVELFEAAPPPEVDNLRQLGRLPTILAWLLGTFAAAAIVNALALGVRRRRQDLAVLRTIGFDATQIRGAIRTNGLAIAATGVTLGIPAGVVLANVAWRLVAGSAFVAGDTNLPVLTMSLVAPAALALALAGAIAPGRRAARVAPAAVLRAD